MHCKIVTLCSICFLCLAQVSEQQNQQSEPVKTDSSLHIGLSEGIGNFSLEVLHFASASRQGNLILSPFTIWTTLMVIAEGAAHRTKKEISHVLRTTDLNVKANFQQLAQYLVVNTTTVQLDTLTTIFVDNKFPLDGNYVETVRNVYLCNVLSLDFSNGEKTANSINTFVSKATRGRITKLVENSDFGDTKMVVTNALYFKGKWTSPFNASVTTQEPFYDHSGKKIGNVNMMYNRFTYPFANIKQLQGRIIELPYGVENRLSMLIMLPYDNVTVSDMFNNFLRLPLDVVFMELKQSVMLYGDDEVDCYIPRFKIESDLVINKVLNDMGISDLFDPYYADLQVMSRHNLHVSKFIHKAEIEVTEEGTVASAVSSAEFANRISVVRFEANKPFAYMIVEKTTNAIVFGGVYTQPSLY